MYTTWCWRRDKNNKASLFRVVWFDTSRRPERRTEDRPHHQQTNERLRKCWLTDDDWGSVGSIFLNAKCRFLLSQTSHCFTTPHTYRTSPGVGRWHTPMKSQSQRRDSVTRFVVQGGLTDTDAQWRRKHHSLAFQNRSRIAVQFKSHTTQNVKFRLEMLCSCGARRISKPDTRSSCGAKLRA